MTDVVVLSVRWSQGTNRVEEEDAEGSVVQFSSLLCRQSRAWLRHPADHTRRTPPPDIVIHSWPPEFRFQLGHSVARPRMGAYRLAVVVQK